MLKTMQIEKMIHCIVCGKPVEMPARLHMEESKRVAATCDHCQKQSSDKGKQARY